MQSFGVTRLERIESRTCKLRVLTALGIRRLIPDELVGSSLSSGPF